MRCDAPRVIVALVIGLGCGSCAKYVEIKNLPGVVGGSSLRSVPPTAFVIGGFGDERTVKDAAGAFGIRKVILRNDVKEVFRQAVAAELRRNGHAVLEGADAQRAAFTINGAVLAFWYYQRSGFFKSGYGATAVARIDISRRGVPDVSVSKQYSGFYERSTVLLPGRVDAVLNEALLNMVKEFASDRDVLALLRERDRAR